MIDKLSRQNFIENGRISCEVRRVEDCHIRTHVHDFFEIEYIISGSGSCFIDGNKFDLLPGMIFFMSPVNTHQVFMKNAEYVNISFSENMCGAELLYELTLTDAAALRLDERARMLIHSLSLELCGNLSGGAYPSMLLDCILAKLIKCIGPKRLPTGASVSQKAIIYIINHFRENISLSELASHMGLTPSYFSALFKKQTGTTFKEYVDRLRFENAKKLILMSDMTVQEICTESGFSCYENFIRRFKKRYGSSPYALR